MILRPKLRVSRIVRESPTPKILGTVFTVKAPLYPHEQAQRVQELAGLTEVEGTNPNIATGKTHTYRATADFGPLQNFLNWWRMR